MSDKTRFHLIAFTDVNELAPRQIGVWAYEQIDACAARLRFIARRQRRLAEDDSG